MSSWVQRRQTCTAQGARERNLKHAQCSLVHSRSIPATALAVISKEKTFSFCLAAFFFLSGESGCRWVGKHFDEKEMPAGRPEWKTWCLKDYFRKPLYIVSFHISHKMQRSVRNMYFQCKNLSRCILCICLGKVTASHSNK